MPPADPSDRLGARERLVRALSSRRTVAVALLSFSSGLPLGLVWIAIPDWLRKSGVDIRLVGLFTLTQAPWMFKIVWSPLMDRFSPPVARGLGRRRGWILLTQIALAALTMALAGIGDRPETPWVIFALGLALAFAAASQDIVLDAYAVEVLEPEEQGIAVGARTALYRAAMYVAGALAITLAGWWSWGAVNLLLAALYLPMIAVTLWGPRSPAAALAPSSLRDAVWEPFIELLGRPRAIEILAFVVLYKFADQLAQSLQRPFLFDMGYSDLDRGLALGTVGLAGTIIGTFAGGALTSWLGLGRSLWIFGGLQIVSNVGFILVSQTAVNRPLMYGAMGFESLTTGLGMGAFGVLLLRLTRKRFSATQYALFSSLFGLSRLIAGPITGAVVHALGWTTFFWLTMVAGLPGLALLARFVPFGAYDPRFEVDETIPSGADDAALPRVTLVGRGVFGGALGGLACWATMAGLWTLQRFGPRADELAAPGFLEAAARIAAPADVSTSMLAAGVLVCAGAAALASTAATIAKARGQV